MKYRAVFLYPGVETMILETADIRRTTEQVVDAFRRASDDGVTYKLLEVRVALPDGEWESVWKAEGEDA